MKSNHEDPDWLEKDVNHVFTKDADTHRILMHFGMLGAVPNPKCDEGKCGYALYTDMSPSFFLITIRTCNCEKLKDNNYAVLLLSRLKHTVREAFEIRDAWLKSLFRSGEMNLTFLEFPNADRN